MLGFARLGGALGLVVLASSGPLWAQQPARATNAGGAAEQSLLVPGFGVEESLPLVPGFGELGALFTVVVTEEDRERAERVLQRRDRNRDGYLDRGELRRARLPHEPLRFDWNHDGRLDVTELSFYYAHRRLMDDDDDADDEEQGSARAQRSDRAERARRARRARAERQEEQEAAAEPRRSYRRRPEASLPDGLPDWFHRLDVDGDGQVTMAEYATSWTPELLAEFARFDLNGDGIITAEECLEAVTHGAERRSR